MTKSQILLLCKIAFQSGQLQQSRKDKVIIDDTGECIAFAKACGGMTSESANDGLNGKAIEGIAKIKYEYSKCGYSSKRIKEALEQPWKDFMETFNILYKEND